jgi:hypothetical protein
MTQLLFRNNDHVLELNGLKNATLDTYVNNANVTVTLVDEDNVEVSGQTWPTTMSYVAASDGIYRCTLEEELVLVPGAFYTAIVDVDAGFDLKARWELRCQAAIRRS